LKGRFWKKERNKHFFKVKTIVFEALKMVEGKWHEMVRKKLITQCNDRCACSHNDSSIGIFRGRISKKNLISNPDLIVFKDKNKKVIEKIIEIEGHPNPKTMLGDLFITRLANTYKVKGKKHKLLQNFPLQIIYNGKKDKLKRIKKLEQETKKKWKGLNFEFKEWK